MSQEPNSRPLSQPHRVGQGPHPVIALHGWFGSATAWRSVWSHLDGGSFSYVFPEYRGYGARMSETGEFSIAEAAADVLEIADKLGFERFSLLGHSMGGSVMQRVLAYAPTRVRAMVGISPVPAAGVPFDEQSWQLFSSAAANTESRKGIVDFTTGNRLTDVWLNAIVENSLANSTPEAVDAYLYAWAQTDFHESIAGYKTPVKVIVGEHDPALGAATMRETFQHWYPTFELEVMSNAGHYAIDETPVALATSVEKFLERC